MWQAFIYPQGVHGLVLLGTNQPIVGKVRHSRKETRIEAKRLVQALPVKLTSSCYEDVASLHPHQMIELYAAGYGEYIGMAGMRWQPDCEYPGQCMGQFYDGPDAGHHHVVDGQSGEYRVVYNDEGEIIRDARPWQMTV